MDINIDDFIRYTLVKRGVSKESARLCKSKFKAVNKWLDLHNTSLSSSSIEQLIYELQQKGFKNNSINGYIFFFRYLKDYCIDRGTYTGFFEGFKSLPKNQTQIILLTYDEIEKITNSYIVYPRSLNNPVYVNAYELTQKLNLNYNGFTRFLASTGARAWSEAAVLKVKHLELEENRGRALFLDTKNHDKRYVYFYGKMVTVLRELIKDKNPDDLVFTNSFGDLIRPQSYSHDLRNRAKSVGITKRVHPHLFRHTYATHLYKATKDIGLVSRALGHRDVKTTMKYINLADDDLESGVRLHPAFRNDFTAQDIIKQIENRVEDFRLHEHQKFNPNKVSKAVATFMLNLHSAVR